MSELLKLYPSIKPYETGFMIKGEHEIYYEQAGNPNGNLLSFYMAGQVEEAAKLLEGSSTLRPIESLCLTKEDAAEANLMLV